MREVLEAASERVATARPFVWVTLAEVRGSAPQKAGAKAIVDAAGLAAGTVGGGKLEAWVIREALLLLGDAAADGDARLRTVNLQQDLGMSCGGEVAVLFERVEPDAWTIAVYGAGHVAQALVRVLITLPCRVRVADPRPEWVRRLPEAPNLSKSVALDLGADVATLAPGSFVVVMTQGHATDLPVLRAAYAWGRFGYLGVLGSTVKAGRLRRELAEAGVGGDELARLCCPIGLPLGESVPAEIAVSVAAQLLQARGSTRRGARSE
jgi:xanthine dehydrogenase accessory factor